MAFKGLTDEGIKRKLASSQGIARPTAQSLMQDIISVTPTLLGIPAMIAPPSSSKKLPKPGEILDTPLGRVKYDAMWEGMPKSFPPYQWTAQDSIARGASFNTKTLEMDDLIKAFQEMIDLRKK